MATSKSLKTAVKKEVKGAEHDARTGNVSTSDAPPVPSKQPAPAPSTDLPTGARSHPPEGFPR